MAAVKSYLSIFSKHKQSSYQFSNFANFDVSKTFLYHNARMTKLYEKKCESSILATLPLLVFGPHPLICWFYGKMFPQCFPKNKRLSVIFAKPLILVVSRTRFKPLTQLLKVIYQQYFLNNHKSVLYHLI